MPFRVASPSLRWKALALAALCGIALAGGFLPAAKAFGEFLEIRFDNAWLTFAAFPIFAGLFYLSAPPPKQTPRLSFREALKTMALPIAISAVFGRFHRTPCVWQLWESEAGRQTLLWLTVCIPLGEEWLFRGWLQSIAERLAPDTRLTETNPLPVAIWVSALAFSLWHSQNFLVEPSGFVSFQMLYTFFTGLWLGWMRWTTGRILPCIIAHFTLNVASNLW